MSEPTLSDFDFTIGQLRGALDVLRGPSEIDRDRFIALLVAVVPRLEELREALARAEAAEADVQAMDDAHHAEWMKLTAEVARYREALEAIVSATPDELDPSHSDGGYDAGQIALAALEGDTDG